VATSNAVIAWLRLPIADVSFERLGIPGRAMTALIVAALLGFPVAILLAMLGVTTLLEGSVRRDGQRLRLSARLIDGATRQQVWSGSFDRRLNDVFAVQAELAGAVVNAVEPTSDLNACDLYLLAAGPGNPCR